MVDYCCSSIGESKLIGDTIRNPKVDRLNRLGSLLESKSEDSGLVLSSKCSGPDPSKHSTCADCYPNIKGHHTYYSTSIL